MPVAALEQSTMFMQTPAPESVGVFGAAGDLGSQLCVQFAANGARVQAFDVQPIRTEMFGERTGVDLKTLLNAGLGRIAVKQEPTDVVAESAIIHWCAPLDVLDAQTLGANAKADSCIVLHNSVMDMSGEAARELRSFGGRVAIVHCLVNEAGMVVVDETSDDLERVTSHLQDAGLNTVQMSAAEHDRLMVRTQAPLALLLGLLPDLREFDASGLLTPSGGTLLNALETRRAMWTDPTIETIFRNPHLGRFIDELKQAITQRDTV